MIIRFIVILVFAIVLTCCGGQPDPRLEEVERLISVSPREAMDSLDAIRYDRLSSYDKEYYDFLMVKSRDKAFVIHKSDSLILRVISNEKRHKSRGRYAEALYYGGRVYHDLGDYPTALNYYQNALDYTPADGGDNVLRGKILAQTGDLLMALRLYEKAIPYVEEALKLDSIQRDSLNMIYDAELLGSLYLYMKNYDKAEEQFRQTMQLSDRISPDDSPSLQINLAWTCYKKGDIEQALRFIRCALSGSDSLSKPAALSCAAFIYKRAGICDTAMMYASELIRDKRSDNNKNGYKILLSNQMRRYVPTDSLLRYIDEYRDEIELYLERNGDRQALLQTSFYNYQLHQREKIKVERDNEYLYMWIFGMSVLILLLIVALLYLKNRNQSEKLRLHEAIDNTKILRGMLESGEDGIRQWSENTEYRKGVSLDINSSIHSSGMNELRMRLREELLSIVNDNKQISEISPVILNSEAYKKIQQYLDAGKPIVAKNRLWDEIESMVIESSPEFKQRLYLLTGSDLSTFDYHLALLIKCGFTPTNVSVLIGKAKNTISYHRGELVLKAFDKKLPTGIIDRIIRLL